jgi:hypothetical protein
LELEPGSPTRGRVRTAPGFDQPFTGWISLLGVLEAAIQSNQIADTKEDAWSVDANTQPAFPKAAS